MVSWSLEAFLSVSDLSSICSDSTLVGASAIEVRRLSSRMSGLSGCARASAGLVT